MDTKDSFVFCHSDFMASLFCTFEDMRRKGELTDFTVTFQNRSFSGHRVILAATIPYFRTVFVNSDREITLKEIDPDSLESLLEFAYRGKIEITCENVQSLLLASEFLQLTQVHDACWEFLEKRMNVNNVWRIRHLAENQLRMNTIGLADDYIGQNFEAFCKSESFLALPFLFLKGVLSRDDLKVSTEECVFEAVIRWAKDSISERKNLLPDLLSVVRLCHLSPVYLAGEVSREEIVRTSIPCRDLIDEAKRYYLSPEERSKIRSSLSRPRKYNRSYEDRSCDGKIVDFDFDLFAVSSDSNSLSLICLDFENAKCINISTFSSIRRLVQAIVFKEKLYIFCTDAIVTFDMKTLKWFLLDETDQGTWESGMVLHNNRIYSFGGGDILSKSDCVRCFDPQKSKWLPMEKMRRRLTDTGVASLAECIYITGGWSDHKTCKTVERYNPAKKKWREVSPMLSVRSGHGCASLKGKVYVCGGRNIASGLGEVYDPLTNQQNPVYEMTYSGSAEVYDPMTNQWNPIPEMTNLRSGITLVSHDKKLYSLDRRRHSSNSSVDLDIYEPEQNKWELCAATIKNSVSDMILVQRRP